MNPLKLNITYRARKITTVPIEPLTSLDGLPPLPSHLIVRGEYDVTSNDGQLKGVFVFCNVLTAYAEDKGKGNVYDGQQIFTGRIQGREGTVCMRTSGRHADDHSRALWTLAPETATGQLKGISGTGTFSLFCSDKSDINNLEGQGDLDIVFA